MHSTYMMTQLLVKRLTFITLFSTGIFFVTSLHGDTLSFVFENDLFAGTDQHYTNGVRLGWLNDALPQQDLNNSIYTALCYQVVNALPLINLQANKNYSSGFSIYQMMFTPKDITTTEPNYQDLPYAGHLMFSFYLFEHDEEEYDEYKLQLGIVGPPSGAESVQKLIHKLTNSTAPQGWSTQLGTQLTLGIAYDHGARIWQRELWYGLSSDIVSGYGLQLGNFYTGATMRGVWRIGSNYPHNFNAYFTSTISDSAILALQEPAKGFGWSFNLGLAVDAIGYFYITDSDPMYEIDRGYFLADGLFSLAFYYDNFLLTVTRQMRYSISESEKNLTYGAASIAWKF